MKNRGLIANGLLIIALIYLFMSVVKIFLPITSVELQKEIDYNFAFNYSLQNIYKDKTKKKGSQSRSSLDFELIGIYSDGKNSVVIVSKDKRTEVIAVGEEYSGYKLIDTTNTLAIWDKDGIRHELSIENTKDRAINNAYKIENNDPFGTKDIKYEDIQYYKNNPQKLWSEININKTAQGYTVTKIKPGSRISMTGLKQGDIIKVINGTELKSDSDAIKFYKDIKTLEFVTISVLRGDKYIDLEYNIDLQQSQQPNQQEIKPPQSLKSKEISISQEIKEKNDKIEQIDTKEKNTQAKDNKTQEENNEQDI